MICRKLTVRASTRNDQNGIAAVQAEAFGRSREAELALALIRASGKTISLVAECVGRVVGHVLLTEIDAPVRSLALAPLAVLPDYREMQVGTSLVRESISRARKLRFDAIFVLGDTPYYERFGFSSALADPFEVGWQGRNFMALELVEGCLKGKSGKLAYPEAFFAQ